MWLTRLAAKNNKIIAMYDKNYYADGTNNYFLQFPGSGLDECGTE